MLKEQATQLTFTHAQAFRQLFNAIPLAIEGTISDKGECARNRIRSSAPRSQIRSRLRPAAQTRPETCILGRCG